MRYFLICSAAMALVITPVCAEAATAVASSGSSANSGSVAGSTSNSSANPVVNTNAAAQSAATQANGQNVTFNPNPADQRITSTPAVTGPTLIAGQCMGATSLGGSGMGIGLMFGTTWQDKACELRETATTLVQTLNDKEAAKQVMCEDRSVRAAYAKIGKPCL